jgi:hypothetical protein
MHMSDSGTSPERPAPRLDAAIDRAVRRMVQADPRPGLTERVRVQLSGPAVPVIRPLIGQLVLATALVLLVLAGLMRPSSRRGEDVGPPAGREEVASAQRDVRPVEASVITPPVQNDAAPADTTPRPRSATGGSRRPHRETIPMPQIGNVFGGSRDTVSSATILGHENTAGRTTNAPATPIEIEVISIPPLAVEPLRIADIPPPDSGR